MNAGEQQTAQTTLVQQQFVQHLPALRGFVVSLVADFSLVDDVVQETFLTVTEKAANFQPGTNFRAWVWTIARFKVLQLLSNRGPAGGHLSTEAVEALCAHAGAEDWLEEAQLRFLSACIGELAPRAREAVELRYRHAQRPPEIAKRMGWTIDAVHVALSRARVALRDCVTKRMAAETVLR